MKLVIAISFLCISLNLLAQNPTEKNVGDFNEVKVYDLIEVNLVKSNETKVKISGANVDDVEIINKNNVLKIRMKIDKKFDGNQTFVTVNYTKLNIIDGNEGAFITSNELIQQDYIELKSQEGARLKIELDVNKLDVKAVSGGSVETTGKANSQEINLNTGGIYKGREFITLTTNISIKAAGDAAVNATNTVNAKIRAGGDIAIYGQPKTVTENTALGGRIKRMD